MTVTLDAETLYNRYQAPLFRYLCGSVGQPETARDLVQEVFIRVARTAAPAGPDHAIRAWLFRIARNLAIDHGRASKRRPETALELDASDHPGRSASQDVSAAVRQALAALASVDRDVFLLREMAGLSWQEIGDACELTPDAVRSRLHRTRIALKDQLAAPIATRLASSVRRDPTGTE